MSKADKVPAEAWADFATRLPAEEIEEFAEAIEKSYRGWTFAEIEAVYGEEAAINAGIATDPDAAPVEVNGYEDYRPFLEVDPELVKRMTRTRS